MPVNASFDEPTIPLRLRRPLAAAWISLGLHAVLIALVQVAPPAAISLGEPVIEARLVTTHATPPTVEAPSLAPTVEMPDDAPVPLLAPSETAEALPVAEPVALQPAQSAPATDTKPPPATLPQPAPAASSPPAASAPVPGVTVTSAVDLTYYSWRDLDELPHLLSEIERKYPPDADRRRLSGKVVLQLKLEADGRVGDIEVVSADPPGLFEDSAVKAFRDARFEPAIKNGRPVRALYQLEVLYDWEGRPR